MNYNKLEKNIIDVLKEQQLKLGYMHESVRLYYPLQSLNRLLDTVLTHDEMDEALAGFCAGVRERLGEVLISRENDRYCFILPEEAGDYVHGQLSDMDFIAAFIAMIDMHGTTIEEVISLFRKYSDKVCVERVDNGEFNYLIYFEDGVPDDYRYCITDEGCHLIYHRFTKEDYEDFDF